MGRGRFRSIRLPGRRRADVQDTPFGPELSLFLHGRGTYSFDMIGAVPFEDALQEIARGRHWSSDRVDCVTSLVCRSGTPLERNTVAVEIGGHMVGYCPSYLASQYREWLDKWRFSAARVQCNAVIVGHWNAVEGRRSGLGVKLDVEMPFKATTL